MAERIADPVHAERMEVLREPVLVALRARARKLGYALGVHGSLAFDLDVIAAPWQEDACGAEELAEALRQEAEKIAGYAFLHPAEAEQSWFRDGCPGLKPHGRLVWSFHLGGGPYIDLSVMPRLPEATS